MCVCVLKKSKTSGRIKGYLILSDLIFTDVLLCHDDELEGRRVAFIFYLLPPWNPSDGGALDLYSTDGVCA